MDIVEFTPRIETYVGIMLGSMILYLLAELALLHFRGRRLRLGEARMSGLGFLSNLVAGAVLARFFLPFGVALFATLGARFSPIPSFGLGLMGWILGWLIYEFWYWVQHFAAHRVRLLWCIHSPHHAPSSIHMLVGTNHHVLEGTLYMPFVAGFMPALFGVDPLVCLSINVVDSLWGSFLHISDEIVPKGRYGILERFLQTPSHHRVHHAKNVRYMDTNYNSITLFWDWVFGTLQPLRRDEPVAYGITREVDSRSFWDTHFREFVLLGRDFRTVPSWPDKLRYLVKPPGWHPGDDSQTAAARKSALSEPQSSL